MKTIGHKIDFEGNRIHIYESTAYFSIFFDIFFYSTFIPFIEITIKKIPCHEKNLFSKAEFKFSDIAKDSLKFPGDFFMKYKIFHFFLANPFPQRPTASYRNILPANVGVNILIFTAN